MTWIATGLDTKKCITFFNNKLFLATACNHVADSLGCHVFVYRVALPVYAINVNDVNSGFFAFTAISIPDSVVTVLKLNSTVYVQ